MVKNQDHHEYHIDILRKMLRRYWVGKHQKREETILEGFPPRHHKQLKKALSQLCKNGMVLKQPHKHGAKYSLDPQRVPEIKDALQRHDKS